MSFTASQFSTLKSHLTGDSTLNAMANAGDYNGVADAYNAAASPDFIVWKSKLLKHEITDEVSPTGTTFTWGGSTGGYINRSQGERDAWDQLWNKSLSVNPSLANVRVAFADIFSGAGAGAQNNRAHLDAMSKRKATRAEKVLKASGTGSDASPALLGWEGVMEPSDVGAILSAA